MTPNSVKAMVTGFIEKYGVEIEWRKSVTEINSRGVPVTHPGSTVVKERVLLLKERFNPISSTEAPIGATLDTTRYIFCLPDVPLERDDIITDSHGNSWRLDAPDWFDVNGEPVCKQAPVQRVTVVVQKGPEPVELKGTVKIVGELKVGETLTADITELEGDGEPVYIWGRADTADQAFKAITDATEAEYILTEDDKNKYIVLGVSRAGYVGHILSEAVGPIEV